MKKGILFLMLAILVVPSLCHSQMWGNKLIMKVTTDCTPYIKKGKLCYDSDDLNLYVGNGTIAELVTSGGSGDVAGPGSSTNNAAVRFDSVSGKLLQDSDLIIDDLGRVFETFDMPLPTFDWELINGSESIQTITDQNEYHVQYGLNYFAPVIDPASTTGSVNIYQVLKVEPTRPNSNSLDLSNSTIHGVYVYARDNGSGGAMSSVRGVTAQGGSDGAADVTEAIGIFGIGIRQGTGDATDVKGVWAQGTAGTSGVGQAITNVYAVDAEIATSSTGAGKDVTIDNAYAIHAEIGNNNYTSGSSTITNGYGAYLKDASGTGTITNLYQLYIEEPTEGATLNYSIYSEGGLNYFGGNVVTAGALKTASVTSDPCGTFPEGAMFYNDTANIPCYCDDSTNDLKFSDNSACF